MQSRRCVACGQTFRPRPQAPQQCYCANASCQRERRRRWQQAKRQGDIDYRANDAQSQRVWREAHPNYWRDYRRRQPNYTERNRAQQRERNARRRTRVIANEDASGRDFSLTSGTYRLTAADQGVIANEDVWTVEIDVISET
jgi:hypothetical protein